MQKSAPIAALAPGWTLPGIVVSADDPEHAGALRVRVPQVYGDKSEDEFVPDDALPWARPCFPTGGLESGVAHVPPVGSAVWVSFWGGDWEKPIWIGSWFPTEDVPAAFASSYDGGQPKTRLVRTENGHVIEMRWKSGEERIEIKLAEGARVLLNQEEPKILLETDGGYKVEINESDKKILLETPEQKIELDDNTPKILIETTGDIEVMAEGDLTATIQGNMTATIMGNVQLTILGTLLAAITGAATATFAAVLSVTVAALYSITAATFTLTAATVDIVGIITLGLAGPKFKLMDERLIAIYNAHIHPLGIGVSFPPLFPIIPDTANTVATKAN